MTKTSADYRYSDRLVALTIMVVALLAALTVITSIYLSQRGSTRTRTEVHVESTNPPK